jgi:hypothetical protein
MQPLPIGLPYAGCIMYVECYEQNLEQEERSSHILFFTLSKPHACKKSHPRAVIALHANLNFILLPGPFKRAA